MPVVRMGPYSVEVSRPDKVLFPGDGITKGDLVAYYRRIAEVMLPHLRGRPVTMHRFPDGLGGEDFFQKEAPDFFPEWVRRATVPKEGGSVTHALCENAATLVYLADQACITPHVWLSRVDRPAHPDRMVFDLDPPDGEFEPVRDAARALQGLLDELDLASFVKTTGSRGLHVVVPLDRSAGFDEARRFARDAARVLAARRPERYTTEIRKQARRGRLYLDVQRNAYAQTAVAPYAVRAKEGAPVATPLAWDELGDPALHARTYTIANIFRRLGQRDDPWAGMARRARGLGGPRRRLDALLAECEGATDSR